ncbi:MAG: ATP-binding cassette domain-containing protein, partial [Pseudomonadota bacterium]
LQAKGATLKAARRQIQIVFQDPFGSLNPRFRVGDILAEPFIIHDVAKGAERRDRVEHLLKSVGLSPDDTRRYPHEFSGGQRQGIAIARAMALEPALIIADEPVSALDVSIQSQILNLNMDMQSERGLAYLFISQDLSVVSEIADRVAVMNEGEIVETGPIESVFAEPQHAYTRSLIEAVPSL